VAKTRGGVKKRKVRPANPLVHRDLPCISKPVPRKQAAATAVRRGTVGVQRAREPFTEPYAEHTEDLAEPRTEDLAESYAEPFLDFPMEPWAKTGDLLEDESRQGLWQVVTIRDSENVQIDVSELQAGIAFQATLQLAISLVLSIAVAGATEATSMETDLIQSVYTNQSHVMNIVVDESRDVRVTVASAQATASIQALLQVLLSLVEKLDIL